MQQYPYLLTVITVVYNGEALIENTIASVARCKSAEVEYVVVDGGSKDGTVSKVRQAGELVDNWISEPDHGIFDAMNKGIKLAKGKWLIFINAGDQLLPGALKKANLKEKADCAIVYGNTIREQYVRTFPYRTEMIETGNIPMCHQSTFYNQKLLGREMYYKTEHRFFGENELFMRVYKKGMKTEYVNGDIAYFLPGGVSGSVNSETRKAKYKAVFKHFGLRGIVLTVALKLGLIGKERYRLSERQELPDYNKVIIS